MTRETLFYIILAAIAFVTIERVSADDYPKDTSVKFELRVKFSLTGKPDVGVYVAGRRVRCSNVMLPGLIDVLGCTPDQTRVLQWK